MTSGSDRLEIAAGADLLPYVDLTDIRTYEIRGSRVGERLSDPDGQALGVQVRVEETSIEVRVRLEVQAVDADLLADVAAVFTFAQPLNIVAPAQTEFAELVGVMAVFPFIREAIHGTAARLGTSRPVLGLLHAGGFRLQPSNDDESEPVAAEPS